MVIAKRRRYTRNGVAAWGNAFTESDFEHKKREARKHKRHLSSSKTETPSAARHVAKSILQKKRTIGFAKCNAALFLSEPPGDLLINIKKQKSSKRKSEEKAGTRETALRHVQIPIRKQKSNTQIQIKGNIKII